ncbi:MAG: tRNA (N6-threonylcarbamoyladenosine(37)-N6)-methyltransferase TrmO [Candidatus Heimdallarchaeota archaeon]
MNLEPIGFVKNEVLNPYDREWGKVISEIIVNENYVSGLIGLEDFTHAIIIFFMHKASFSKENHLERHPKRRLDLPKIDIFAQRARHRPNPIGITSVQIINVKNNILTVKGLDAIDGTPIVDIKPYFPCFDKIDDAETPSWVEEIMMDYF